MTRWSSAAVAAVLLGAIPACVEPPPPPEPLPTPPSITRFGADKSRIQIGEEVTLSFAVENAQTVEIVDQLGQTHAVTGDLRIGSATARPKVTSFYVLRVRGAGGSASSFAQVAVDEDLKDVFLVSVPPIVDSGQKAHLLWSAFRANTADITSSDGETIPLDAAAGAGTLEVAPKHSTTWTLTARGLDTPEPLTATATIAVRPVLGSFTAEPAAADPGETITFNWETQGAGSVTLNETVFGELFTATSPEDELMVEKGTFAWTVPSTL